MNLGYTTGNPGDNVRLDLGLNFDYRDNSYGASATIMQDFQNADPYFNRFNTTLNWNSQNGFSNNINYTLSQKAVNNINQGVAGLWNGFTNAMGNNWNNVLGGFGWLMGRKEGITQRFTNSGLVDPFSQNPMLGNSGLNPYSLLAGVGGSPTEDTVSNRQMVNDGFGDRFPEEYYGADNWIRTSNDKYKNDRIDDMFENYEGLERIRHRIINSSGGNETYYAALPSDLPKDILQDIISDGPARLRRTIVSQPDPDNPDRILVYRSYMNSDGEWVIGTTWDIVQNETGTWRIHRQETENGSYNWIRINPKYAGSGKPHPNYPEPVVHIGYYNSPGNPHNDAPFVPDSITPLQRIEIYGYLNSEWKGSIGFNSSTGALTPSSSSPIPSGHSGRTWRQIVQENLSGTGRYEGFHESINRNPDGSFDTSSRR